MADGMGAFFTATLFTLKQKRAAGLNCTQPFVEDTGGVDYADEAEQAYTNVGRRRMVNIYDIYICMYVCMYVYVYALDLDLTGAFAPFL